MKKAFFGFAILIFSLSLQAQHCGFDFAYLLVVEICDPKTGKNIPNLEVQLADSLGNLYPNDRIHHYGYYQNHYFPPDSTLRLVQNPLHEKLPFLSSFVENSYFIIVQGNNLGIRKTNWAGTILIKDHDGKENLEKFGEKVIRIKGQSFLPLCGRYNEQDEYWEKLKKDKIKVFLERQE